MSSVRISNDHRRRLLVDRHRHGRHGRAERSLNEVAEALDAFFVDRSLLRHTTLRRTIFAMPLDAVPLAHGANNERLVRSLRSQLLGWIAERYLRRFAPATLTDLAWWTGLPKGILRTALDGLRAREVDLDGVNEPGFVAATDDLEAPDIGGAVELLPGLDSTTMGWKRRSWYVDDLPATGLFDRNGNARPTLWVDGSVAGTWAQRADGEVVTVLTSDVGSDARAAIATETPRIGDWLGDVRVTSRYPTSLTKQLTVPDPPAQTSSS